MRFLTHGGRRPGAGRKCAPTRTVRVPLGTESVARALAEQAMAHVLNALRQSDWYRQAPVMYRSEAPVIVLRELVSLSDGVSNNGSPALYLVGTCTVGPHRTGFRVRADFRDRNLVLLDPERV